MLTLFVREVDTAVRFCGTEFVLLSVRVPDSRDLVPPIPAPKNGVVGTGHAAVTNLL